MASLGYKLAPTRLTGEAAAIMSIRLGENENKGRPLALAIVSNCLTPYRLAAHVRIARELSDVRLWSVFTHEQGDAAWTLSAPGEINPVLFGPGEPVSEQPKLKNAVKEWRRGGRIIRWLIENRIDVVAMMGYNDAGRMRIMRWCRRGGVPCLLWGDSNVRGDQAVGLRRLVKRMVVGRMVRGASGILVCGRLGREYFLRYGASPDKIFYFPYEPDYSIIENTTVEAVEAARQRLGLASNRRRLIYAGRLVPVKRVDLADRRFRRHRAAAAGLGSGDRRRRTAAWGIAPAGSRGCGAARELGGVYRRTYGSGGGVSGQRRAGAAQRLRAVGCGCERSDRRGIGGGVQ
jgi:glycosyltransferase involved in cell wall biosynthesis